MTNKKRLYKYLKIYDDDENHVIENLSKNQLYFSDPTEFNDPFDSKVYFDEKGTREQWINWHIQNEHISRKEAIDRINRYFEVEGDFVYPRINKEYHKQKERGLHGDIKKKGLRKVCCFSETCKSILMWSHYADYHRGICLCFRYDEDADGKYILLSTTKTVKATNINEDKDHCFPLYRKHISVSRGIFLKIDYVPYIPSVNIFNKPNQMIEKIEQCFLAKSSGWRYEKEHRILLSESNLENGVINYDKKDLEGIIFGLNTTKKDTIRVHETIKENYKGFKVNFYEVKEIIGKYNIKIKKIPNIEKYIENLK